MEIMRWPMSNDVLFLLKGHFTFRVEFDPVIAEIKACSVFTSIFNQ